MLTNKELGQFILALMANHDCQIVAIHLHNEELARQGSLLNR